MRVFGKFMCDVMTSSVSKDKTYYGNTCYTKNLGSHNLSLHEANFLFVC